MVNCYTDNLLNNALGREVTGEGQSLGLAVDTELLPYLGLQS